jgi:predicted ATPase
VRREQFLQARGTTEWPDGAIAARYGFVHALYQEVLYEQLSASRRVRLHRQIGEREEQGYGERASEIAAELAVHFERGRDYERAVRYRQQAGQNAMRRNANQEAIDHFTKGLELLQTLPDTPARARQEVTLQLTLGAPLLATKGYAAPELEHAYRRARELCEKVDETAQLFPVLHGLWTVSVMRAEYRKAQELAEQLLSLAQNAKTSDLLVEAHWAVGYTAYCQRGAFPLAREHFTRILALYDLQEHGALGFIYGQDPKVTCLSYMAWTLWQLGYPEQAVKKMDEAIRFAENLSQSFSVVFTIIFMSFLRQYRREWQPTQAWAEKAIAISLEQGFPHWVQYAGMARGWALAQQGQGEQGVADIQQHLAGQRAAGARSGRTIFSAWLAEACEKAGHIDEGLKVLAEALTFAEQNEERFYEAELYRLKGELTLQQFKVQGSKFKVKNPHSAIRNQRPKRVS